MATLSGFRSAFPECNTSATNAQVRAELAATKVNADEWGSNADTVIYLTIAANHPPTNRARKLYLSRITALSEPRQAIADARLDLYDDRLDDIEAEVATTQAVIDAEARLVAIEDDVTAAQAGIGTLETTVDDHEDRIAALEPP